jgi:putative transcriptional regulator
MKNTIKLERARQNITQEELAQKLGVSRQSINAIETGRFVPSTVLALKIARFFNSTVNQLFELEKND